MTETENNLAIGLRLNSRIKDQKVWVEGSDNRELLWTVDQVLKACRDFNGSVGLSDVEPQVRALWKTVGEWVSAQGDCIDVAFLRPIKPGRLMFLVVQKDSAYNSELADALLELDINVANDDRFALLKLAVRLVPPMPRDQLEAMIEQG